MSSSANPANPLTRAEFCNACTSVLQGITCLQRQGTIVNQDAVDTLDQLGLVVNNLKVSIQFNKEFYIDGPLVRFLTAQVSKGKTVIQEMKRTCGPQSSKANGPDYVERHLSQHISDIRSVINELLPYQDNRVFNENTTGIDAGVDERHASNPPMMNTVPTPILKNSQTPPSRKSDTVSFTGLADNALQPTGYSAVRDLTLSEAQPGFATQGDHLGSENPGVFQHMNDVKNIYPKHSPNWPPYEDKPPLLMERTRPPLVHSGLRDMQNYTNLPQFTGVNLPVPTMPDGEFGHQAPHNQHWDYHNNRMY